MMRNLLGAICLAVCFSGAGTGWALDPAEIGQLVRTRVDDTVIINMVQNQKLDRPLTAREVVELSAAGASPALLEYITRAEAVSSAYVAVQPAAPVIVTSPEPSVTYVEPAPTVVTQQPTVVVASPPTVYYSSPYYTTNYVYPRYRWGPSYYPSYYPYAGSNYYFGFSYGSRGWYGRDSYRRPPPPPPPRGGWGGPRGGPRGGPPPGGPPPGGRYRR